MTYFDITDCLSTYRLLKEIRLWLKICSR